MQRCHLLHESQSRTSPIGVVLLYRHDGSGGQFIHRFLTPEPLLGILRDRNHEIAVIRAYREQHGIRLGVRGFQNLGRPCGGFDIIAETRQIEQSDVDAILPLRVVDGILDLRDVVAQKIFRVGDVVRDRAR